MPKATKMTPKQMKAMALISNGVKPYKAMRQAGYSYGTSKNPKENLLSKPQVAPIIDKVRRELKKKG